LLRLPHTSRPPRWPVPQARQPPQPRSRRQAAQPPRSPPAGPSRHAHLLMCCVAHHSDLDGRKIALHCCRAEIAYPASGVARSSSYETSCYMRPPGFLLVHLGDQATESLRQRLSVSRLDCSVNIFNVESRCLERARISSRRTGLPGRTTSIRPARLSFAHSTQE